LNNIGGKPSVQRAIKGFVQNPLKITPFSAEVVRKTLSPMLISESATAQFTEFTPFSVRIPSFQLNYHPTVGFDISCALFLALTRDGCYPWEVVNVCEVVPSELVCISVLQNFSSLSNSIAGLPSCAILNFWINKWSPAGASNTPLPHLGVGGGGPFALASRAMAPLNLQLDLTGVTYANLLFVENGHVINQLVPLNPKVLDLYVSSTESTLGPLLQGDRGIRSAEEVGANSYTLGLFSGGGVLRARDFLKEVKIIPETSAEWTPSSYLACRYSFGEKFPQVAGKWPGETSSEPGHAVRVYGTPSAIEDSVWRVATALSRSTTWASLSKEDSLLPPPTSTSIHWKDPEVKEFWCAPGTSFTSLASFQSVEKTSPEALEKVWRSLAKKVEEHRKSSSLDGGRFAAVIHPAFDALRKRMT